MNLSEIRDAVRTQLDLDEDDLPNTTLDRYVREAYNRTIQMERRWPFFESSWTVTSDSNGQITMPSTAAGVVSLVESNYNERLLLIGQEMAEDNFQGSTQYGNPDFYSLWGDTIYLWPTPAETYTYTLRGWRKPLDWVSSGAATEVDADERLHIPIIHYAVSLAYAQLEDPELENAYMRRWAQTVERAHDDIMRPQHHEPLVLNGGTRRIATRRPRFVWDI